MSISSIPYTSTQTRPDDSIEDDDIKSDVFVTSINGLVAFHSPRTIEAFSDLLSNNGYYGRFEIVRVSGASYRDLAVKVRVYLPNSVYSYEWPYLTYYSLTTNKFGKRKKPKGIRKESVMIKSMAYFLCYDNSMHTDVEAMAEAGYRIMGWATKAEYVNMTILFVQAGLFSKGVFVLKHEDDMMEVLHNLFSYSYFML